MSDEMNPEQGRETELSESGLLRSVEPIQGGLSMSGTDVDSDSSDSNAPRKGDTDGTDSDSDATDSDISADSDGSDESDADGTDGGDDTESESGLGGENPLGLNRTRAVKNGDDKDTRDNQ
jgi:hypothetical protein